MYQIYQIDGWNWLYWLYVMGDSMWKVWEKHDQFFFGFFTWKVKSISYFSNKNTFLDIFGWIFTIFFFFKEIYIFVKLDVDDSFFSYFFFFRNRSTKKHIGHNIGLYFHNFVCTACFSTKNDQFCPSLAFLHFGP